MYCMISWNTLSMAIYLKLWHLLDLFIQIQQWIWEFENGVCSCVGKLWNRHSAHQTFASTHCQCDSTPLVAGSRPWKMAPCINPMIDWSIDWLVDILALAIVFCYFSGRCSNCFKLDNTIIHESMRFLCAYISNISQTLLQTYYTVRLLVQRQTVIETHSAGFTVSISELYAGCCWQLSVVCILSEWFMRMNSTQANIVYDRYAVNRIRSISSTPLYSYTQLMDALF